MFALKYIRNLRIITNNIGYWNQITTRTTIHLTNPQILNANFYGQKQHSNPRLLLLNNNSILMNQCRFAKKKFGSKHKSKKGAQAQEEDEEDEEEEEENDDDYADDEDPNDQDGRTVQTTVISRRLDAIGKTIFNIPRSKFEEFFYNNMIRVNGERVVKKSYEVHQNDQIDMIKGWNIEQQGKLDVTRVEIIMLDDKAAKAGRFRIEYHKINKLLIDNYQQDPFDGTIINTN